MKDILQNTKKAKVNKIDWKNLKPTTFFVAIVLIPIAIAVLIGLAAMLYALLVDDTRERGKGYLVVAVFAFPYLIIKESLWSLKHNYVKNYTFTIVLSVLGGFLIGILIYFRANFPIPGISFFILPLFYCLIAYFSIRAWSEVSWVHKLVIGIIWLVSLPALYLVAAVFANA